MSDNKLWIDTRLTEEEMNFLRDTISEENKHTENIGRSTRIIDKDNWFYETTLKKLTERMFYRNWDNYCKYYIEKEEPQTPKFELITFWVNHQKQYVHIYHQIISKHEGA